MLGGLVGLIAILEFGGGFVLGSTWLFAAHGARLRPAASRASRSRSASRFAALVYAVLHQGAVARRCRPGRSSGCCRLSVHGSRSQLLGQGLLVAIQPGNLLFAGIGVLLGTLVGILPGISPSLTVALLLPVTFKLDPTGSIIMFAGIYFGGMYGSSTTAILLNTPGEAASIATAIEGHKMARAGRGGPALATAAIGSFVAGTIATLGLALLAPSLVDFAVQFGPWDYFALMVLAFVTVSATFGNSVLRGLTSLALGLVLGLVGIDKLTGQSRLAFGVPSLLDGISITTLAVGLFAMGETLYVASRFTGVQEKIEAVRGSLWMTQRGLAALVEAVAARHRPRLSDRRAARRAAPRCRRCFRTRSSASSRAKPERVRQGRDRRRRRTGGRQQRRRDRHAGAAAGARPADVGDRGDDAGRLPAVRPGAGAAAVRHQRRPGLGPDRQLLHRQPDAAGAEPAAGRPVGASCWTIPQPWLYAGILVFAAMGTLAANPSTVELVMLVAFGIVGYLMRCWDYPVAPMIVGLILGPMAESQFRRALQISLGDELRVLQAPGLGDLLALALLALVAPLLFKGLRRFHGEDA